MIMQFRNISNINLLVKKFHTISSLDTKMKIILLGATGNTGLQLAEQACNRGHGLSTKYNIFIVYTILLFLNYRSYSSCSKCIKN
jgi:hypothetical protein